MWRNYNYSSYNSKITIVFFKMTLGSCVSGVLYIRIDETNPEFCHLVPGLWGGLLSPLVASSWSCVETSSSCLRSPRERKRPASVSRSAPPPFRIPGRPSCSGSCRLSAAGFFLKCVLCLCCLRPGVGGRSSRWTWSWQKWGGKATSRSSPSCRQWGWAGEDRPTLPFWKDWALILVLQTWIPGSQPWLSTPFRVTEEVSARLLKSAAHRIERDGILATRLCTHKDDVELTNEDKLKQLPGGVWWFSCVYSNRIRLICRSCMKMSCGLLGVRANQSRLLSFRVGPRIRGSGQPPGSGQGDGRPQPRGQSPPAQSGSSGTSGCSWRLHVITCVRSQLFMSWPSQGHADKEPGRASGSGERSTRSRGGLRVWKTRSVAPDANISVLWLKRKSALILKPQLV